MRRTDLLARSEASGRIEAPSDRTAPVIEHYCLECHDEAAKKGNVNLEGLDLTATATDPERRERVLRKLAHRQWRRP